MYLDEAHRLTGSAIGLENLLAQARATKLSVVLATQFLQRTQQNIVALGARLLSRMGALFHPGRHQPLPLCGVKKQSATPTRKR